MTSPAASDDAALVRAVQSGDDRAAFAQLVARHQSTVRTVLRRLTRGDTGLADDLAQETFVLAWRNIRHFRFEARFSTWIYRIVQNVCSQARAARVPEMSYDQTVADRPRFEPAVIDRAAQDLELRDRLEKAIAQLPESYQMLVAAHYLQGVQYEALAETLNIPLGTVKTHLYRAKRRLRELLTT